MRRANGTGTVVRLSGNRRRPYAVRVSERDKYGQIVQKALGYFATAREAQEALDEHNRLKAQGLAPAINQMSMTVGQVYEAWSARAYAKVGPQAVRGYAASWKMRVSRFADRKMGSVMKVLQFYKQHGIISQHKEELVWFIRK